MTGLRRKKAPHVLLLPALTRRGFSPRSKGNNTFDININNAQIETRNQRQPPLPPVAKRSHQHTHTFSQVQHSHEQQPKSRPPSHTQLQANSTRKTPKANTPNQTPKPQIRLPRICPGFPRREKRILRPTRSRDFTSHMQANLQSPLQQQHTDSGRSLADVTFENAARNRRIFRSHSCPY